MWKQVFLNHVVRTTTFKSSLWLRRNKHFHRTQSIFTNSKCGGATRKTLGEISWDRIREKHAHSGQATVACTLVDKHKKVRRPLRQNIRRAPPRQDGSRAELWSQRGTVLVEHGVQGRTNEPDLSPSSGRGPRVKRTSWGGVDTLLKHHTRRPPITNHSIRSNGKLVARPAPDRSVNERLLSPAAIHYGAVNMGVAAFHSPPKDSRGCTAIAGNLKVLRVFESREASICAISTIHFCI